MTLNLMNIVIRLPNIPIRLRNPDIARRLWANAGTVLEVLPPRGDYVQSFIRVRVQVDISEPLQRGVYMRTGNGGRQWIGFSYERLPVYCFLCEVMGHIERKCQLRFGEGFSDLGKNFPYGEWLKVLAPGSTTPR